MAKKRAVFGLLGDPVFLEDIVDGVYRAEHRHLPRQRPHRLAFGANGRIRREGTGCQLRARAGHRDSQMVDQRVARVALWGTNTRIK